MLLLRHNVTGRRTLEPGNSRLHLRDPPVQHGQGLEFPAAALAALAFLDPASAGHPVAGHEQPLQVFPFLRCNRDRLRCERRRDGVQIDLHRPAVAVVGNDLEDFGVEVGGGADRRIPLQRDVRGGGRFVEAVLALDHLVAGNVIAADLGAGRCRAAIDRIVGILEMVERT